MSVLRRTRVLAATDTLEVGGAERVAVDIANSLSRDRHDPFFCATRGDGPLRDVLLPDVDVGVIGRRATWDVAGMLRFAQWVNARDIDLIHTHGRGTMQFVALCRRLGLIDTAHVYHDHWGHLHLDRRASTGLRTALHTVDGFLGVDQRLCTWAREDVGLPAERVHLVRSGVDLTRFVDVEPMDLRAAFDLAGVEVVLVMVANYRRQKDHPTVLRALALLPPEVRSRLGVVTVGSTESEPGYFDRCWAMAEDLGVTDQLRVAGTRDDTLRLMAGADAGLLASKNETGPLVVLEYMASRLPFIATDTGEITRALAGVPIGWTPAPRDPHQLADALRSLLDAGPRARAAMGAQGRQVAEASFDQVQVTRQIEQIYHQVLIRGTDSPTSDPARLIPATRSDRQYSNAALGSRPT